MDWFTKEVNRNGEDDGPVTGNSDGDGDGLVKDEDEDEPEQPFNENANGRRLRKRDQKRNYKDIQRSAGISAYSSGSSSSWSCASSTASSTSSNTAMAVISPFIANAQPLFTLEELRWAFLPKAHKSHRPRSSKKWLDTGSASKRTAKVPYSGEEKQSSAASSRTSSRRASREVQPSTATANTATAEYTTNNDKLKLIGVGIELHATKSRIAKGDNFRVRGKRRDSQGNVQYLIEWVAAVKSEVDDVEDEAMAIM